MHFSRFPAPFSSWNRFRKLARTNSTALRSYSYGSSGKCSGILNYGSPRNSRILASKFDQFKIPMAAISFFNRSPDAASPSDMMDNKPESSYPMEEIGTLPEPPQMPTEDALRELQITLADNMREIGLASYATPAGWIQNLLDVLHSSTGLPWWECIVLSTIMIRALTFPVMVYSQKKAAIMSLHRPEFNAAMAKVDEANRSGDLYERNKAVSEMQEFMKEKQLPTPMKMFLPTLANGVVFASYFMALRGMARQSLWSLHHEGILWWPDLTAIDPTFILPVICAFTTFTMLELGLELGNAVTTMRPTVRWIMRIFPFTIIIFGKMMPTAVLMYWVTSNTVSILISLVFRIPKVRSVLKIAPLPPKKDRKKWKDSLELPVWFKTLFTNPRSLWNGIVNWRKNRAVRKGAHAPSTADIRKSDLKAFKAAGEGPMPPTFTFDPKTKYREVFEQKTVFRRIKEGIFGMVDKKKPVRKSTAA